MGIAGRRRGARVRGGGMAWLLPVVLLLSACGEDADPQPIGREPVVGKAFDALSAEAILDAVIDDTAKLDTVVVEGDMEINRQEGSFQTRVASTGDCVAVVRLGETREQYLQIGGTVYVKGNRAYWAKSLGKVEAKELVKAAQGRWVTSVAQAAREDFCNVNFARRAQIDGARLVKGTPEKIDKLRVIPIEVRTPSVTMKLWVTTGDEHHLAKMTIEGGSQTGTIRMSGFNEPIELVPPAADQVVDRAALGLPN